MDTRLHLKLIIIYDNRIPPLFQLDDFVIVVKESVVGIIEVKTTLRKSEFNKINKKAHENGKLIVGDNNLKFGCFISNLLESILININQNGCYVYHCVQHTDVFYEYLYPLIENGGKENYSINKWQLLLD